MWQKIISAIRKGLIRLGLLKSIGEITEHKDIEQNAEMFKRIEAWKDLYKGYHEPFHSIQYKTIDGLKTRRMDTLMVPKMTAAEMASLIFNEKCEISIGDGESEVSKFVEEVFKNNKFDKKFQDYLEYSFAHGGMVIKPYIEGEKLMLSFVTADSFIPISWRNDSIYEAVFPFEFKKRNKKFTHLEWHLWEDGMYVIRNEVYESMNGSDLGTKVPLADFFPNLEEEVYISGLKRSIFSYFKPNTANNIDTNSPLGISIFANALDTIKAIDTAFDSFNREFRLGKKRIILPAHMIKTVLDNETGEMHRYFDANDETYEAFNSGDMDENQIQEVNVTLRVEEHISAINALLNLYSTQTGFSTGTFTFDGESVKTATEVVSENSKTFKSKKSHEIIIEAALQELIGSIVAMGELYGMINAPEDYEVTVTFDDSIVEDNAAEQSRQIQLVSNKLQSRLKAIMVIHGLTEEDAQKLMEEINEENATATEESVNFFGGRGD